jgi:hypothetical protein
MKDDRLRVPVSDEYVAALGRAAYVFSYCEWCATNCGEKLEPGFTQNALRLKYTAGDIANRLACLMSRRPADAPARERGIAAAAEFRRLTGRRNDLLHSNPGTAPDGEQGLFRHGSQWTVQKVNDVADEFAANGIELNEIHHRVL